MFAKMFDSERFGQLVVMIDTNDVGDPVIFVYGNPENLGTYSVGIGFPDEDEGWDNRDSVFADLTLEHAESIAAPIFEIGV